MSNEVNEVINNICNKLGYAASEITPEMARYMIAKDTFAVIASVVILVISVLIIAITNKKLQVKLGNYQWANDTYETVITVIMGIASIMSVIALLTFGADLIGWIASPKASMVEYVLSAIK